MKIVYFVHQFFPQFFYGTETYTLSIAKGMQAAGHDVTVVTAIPITAEKSNSFYQEYIYEGIPVISLDKNWLPHRGFREAYYQKDMDAPLRMILERIRPDVVHVTHLLNHSAILLELTRNMRIPTIATLTDFFAICPKGILQSANGQMCRGPNNARTNCITCILTMQAKKPNASPVLKWLAKGKGAISLGAKILMKASRLPGLQNSSDVRLTSVRQIRRRMNEFHRFYGNYAATIVPTRYLKDTYERNNFDIPMHLQHFGVDINRNHKPNREDSEPLRFGYIGQITRHKGVDLLIDAFCDVPLGSELHIYGQNDRDQTFMDGLKQRAGKAQCKVFFHNSFPPDKMAEVLLPIDVLVIPSRWNENSPLVLLNALATHTPVIVSDAQGLTEFVTHQENGFVFSMGDRGSLSSILVELSVDKHCIWGMSKHINYERSIFDMCEEIQHLYQKVLI